jgi:photosystem II stability/assembly factor-like uncharacterized protein
MILTLALDAQHPETLYAGTSLDGVYHSDDGARSWRPINTGLDTQGWEWIGVVTVDPRDGRHLYYTGAVDGIPLWESVDGGDSWEKREAQCPRRLVDLAVDPQNADILYAAEDGSDVCPAGVYKSPDGGVTWQPANVGIEKAESLSFWKLAINPKDSMNIYVSDPPHNLLYRSGDGAASWSPLSVQASCNALEVAPQDGRVLYCGAFGEVFKSTNGGQSWGKSTLPPGARDVRSLAISSQNQKTLYAGGLGVYRSADGGTTWASVSQGLGSARLELTVDPRDSSVLYVESSDCELYRSRDQGATWDKVTDRGCNLTIDPTTGALYRVEGHRAMRSADGGHTWTEIAVPEPNLSRIVIHPRDSNVLYAVYNRQNQYFMYTSSDTGQTWERVGGMESIFIANLFFNGQQGQVAYTFVT